MRSDPANRPVSVLTRFVRPFLIGLILFLTYSLTRPPYLSLTRGTDGGELTVAAATFGVAHPPGYGLYTLVGGLAIRILPGENAVHKMQTFSLLIAISLSLAVGGLAASQFTDPVYRRQAFTLAALLCGWSRVVWEQALMIEVYLFLALLLAILWGAMASRQGLACQTPTRIFLIGHIFGLALTHHLTALLWLPGRLILLGRPNISRLDVLRRVPIILLGCITGLWPWLYLMARAGHVPQVNWGGIERGIEAFIAHITAQEYRVFLKPFSLEALLRGIAQWITSVPTQISPFGAVLLLVGIVLSVRHRQRRVWLLAMVAWVICVAGFTGLYRAPETQTAYTLALITPIVIITTLGLMSLTISWSSNMREIMIWILPLMIFFSHAQFLDYRGDTSGLEFLLNVDYHAPPNAIILVERDAETFLLWEAHTLEGWRPDVTIINVTLLHQEWYAASLSALTDLPLAGAIQAERLQSLYTTSRPLIAPRLIKPPSGMRAIPLGQGWYCLARSADACS